MTVNRNAGNMCRGPCHKLRRALVLGKSSRARPGSPRPMSKVVHRSRPKWVSVDLIPLSKGAGNFRVFVVKVVADIGHDNLSLPNGAWDEDPVVI